MLHNGRCGSTVVGNLLAQNPNIHWASELYTAHNCKVERRKSAKNLHLAKELIVENPIELLKNSIIKPPSPIMEL